MKEKEQVRFYRSFTDDFVESRNQACQIPRDYVWIKKSLPARILAGLIYVAAWIFSLFYCRLWLRVRFQNRSVLKQYRDRGYFLYGNHTQPMGDAFIPAQVCGTKHIYTVAEAANLGIPVLGKLLPLMGALPVPEHFSQMKEFWNAVETRIEGKKCVVVYPEAHVWPWYTGIRPFPETSFHFPVDTNAPSFCMTVTYQEPKRLFAGMRKAKSDHGGIREERKKPRMTVYIDGPFYPDASLTKKERQKKLCEDIHACMLMRSKNSTYEYIHYEKAKSEPG